MSVHEWHVIKDQMLCCCCVPLGMALHIIAVFDILVAVVLVVQGLEFNRMISTNPRAIQFPVFAEFYSMAAALCFTAMGLYSAPRTLVYFFTLKRHKSYVRMRFYFRSRVVTFIGLFLVLLGFFIFTAIKARAIVEADQDLN